MVAVVTLREQLMRDEGLRACIECRAAKPRAEFHKNSGRKGTRKACKLCVHARQRTHYYANRARIRENQKRYERAVLQKIRADPSLAAKRLLDGARSRAKRFGVPFALKATDIRIPELCPVLGVPFAIGTRRSLDASPTLDRVVPSRGYVPGNVVVVSMKANRMKSNATADELLRVGLFYKKLVESWQ